MATPVEDAVEVHGVELPARRDGRDIFVEASDESNVAWPRLGGHASVRDAESSMLEDAGPQKRSKVSRDEVVVGFRVRFRVRLERLISA